MRSFRRNQRSGACWILVLVAIAEPLWGQEVNIPVRPPARSPARAQSDRAPGEYVLGPEDQISIQSLHTEEIAAKPLRIDMNGDVTVPMIGRLHAGGCTVQQLEQEVNRRLAKYVVEPQATVSVVEFHSQPVSVLGAVNSPGVHQVQGRKTFAEMLSLAGGLRPDAGYRVTLTRRMEWGTIPVPQAVIDATGKASTAEFKLKDIMTDNNELGNLPVMPYDIISVPKAEMVYVIGDVRRPGGFALGENETVSVLQLLSMAEGWERTAAPENARIIRPSKSGPNEETPVDIKKVLKGQAADFALHGQEILFIPGSTGKRAALRALEAALQTGSGVVIWRSAR